MPKGVDGKLRVAVGEPWPDEIKEGREGGSRAGAGELLVVGAWVVVLASLVFAMAGGNQTLVERVLGIAEKILLLAAGYYFGRRVAKKRKG